MRHKLFYFIIVLTLIATCYIVAENTPAQVRPPDVTSGPSEGKDLPKLAPEQSPEEKARQERRLYQLKLKENPNDIETHRAYQNFMRQWDGLNDLKDEYIGKLKAEPQNPLYHYLYGRLLDGKELEDAFNKAIELETKSPNPELRFWIYYGLGQFYKDTKKYKEALQNLERTQRLKPDFLDVQHQMALIYYEMNDITEALNIWDKLLKIKPDYLDARLGKGIALKTISNYDNAIQELENILKIDENYWKAYEPLIQCYHAKKDYKKGEELRTKIKELYQKTTVKDFKRQELIVIDIINIEPKIIVVKERITPCHFSLEARPINADYYFEIYQEGIDKKSKVFYKVLYGIYLDAEDKQKNKDVFWLYKVIGEIGSNKAKRESVPVKEYTPMPAYLDLLTEVIGREKGK